MQSDARLAGLAAAGHEQAFATIVTRHRPALERFCTGIEGPGALRGRGPRAFVNAHAAMTTTEPPQELRPWLYRIARNVSLNVLRGARDEAPLGTGVQAAPSERPDEAAERSERFRTALAAVAAPPPAQRDAIVLRELEGRSHDEIATALAVTAGAARQHLFRARATVRAAATAITPEPVLTRSPSRSDRSCHHRGDGGPRHDAVFAKSAVGLLAAGAIAGTAVGTGVVPAPLRDRAPTAAGTTTGPASAALAGPAAAAVTSLPARGTGGAGSAGPASGGPPRSGHGSRDAGGHRPGRGQRSSEQAHGHSDKGHGPGDRPATGGRPGLDGGRDERSETDHGFAGGHVGRSDAGDTGSGSEGGSGSREGSGSHGGSGSGEASHSGSSSGSGSGDRLDGVSGTGSGSEGGHPGSSSPISGSGDSGSGSSGTPGAGSLDAGESVASGSGSPSTESSGSGSSGSGPSGADRPEDGH